MGTNFYFQVDKNHEEDEDSNIHIGKRSAAGLWCKKCRLPLVSTCEVDDNTSIMNLRPKHIEYGSDGIHDGKVIERSNTCYICGKKGVPSCSFLWAIPLHIFKECNKDYLIIDEYNNEIKDFSKVMKSCSWQRFHMTGEDFS